MSGCGYVTVWARVSGGDATDLRPAAFTGGEPGHVCAMAWGGSTTDGQGWKRLLPLDGESDYLRKTDRLHLCRYRALDPSGDEDAESSGLQLRTSPSS